VHCRLNSAILPWLLVAWLIGCRPIGELFFGIRPDLIGPNEFTADPLLQRLAVAIDRGNDGEVAKAVLDGANVNATGKDGFCLLYWAMARNNAKGFEALLSHGADLEADYRDPEFLPEVSYRRAVLLIMLGLDNQACLKAALRQGLDPNFVVNPKNGMTLLAWAGHEHSTTTRHGSSYRKEPIRRSGTKGGMISRGASSNTVPAACGPISANPSKKSSMNS
jgi:hypothetical protein